VMNDPISEKIPLPPLEIGVQLIGSISHMLLSRPLQVETEIKSQFKNDCFVS